MGEAETYPQIRTVGLDGLLVTFAAKMGDAPNRAAIAFRAYVDALGWPEVVESASTLVSAFFRIDLVEHAPVPLVERLKQALEAQDWLSAPLPDGRRLWTIPTVLDGPQFDEAADLRGSEPKLARQELAKARVRVLTLGFAPGQPYMGHLPKAWDIPRMSTLTRVPQGALVVAVRQLIVFANASQTGWRHVGQTAFQCFRPASETPIALRAGDEVQLTEVSAAELDRIAAQDKSGNGGATIEPIS